jgi:DNA invertase Pin-like site-specific DNA recombinase
MFTLMKIGYARVSREDQELGRQIKALQEYGCEVIYTDKISGTKASRPDLDKMREALKPGDIVVVQKLDRLGRSMLNLLSLIDEFNKNKVGFISLTDNFDTNTPVGMLVFHMVAAFARFERDLISERTKNGLAFAKSKGVKLGKAPMSDDIINKAKALEAEGLKVKDIAAIMGVSRPTVYKALES